MARKQAFICQPSRPDDEVFVELLGLLTETCGQRRATTTMVTLDEVISKHPDKGAEVVRLMQKWIAAA